MKVLIIIAQKAFRDEELADTMFEMERAQIDMDVASLTTDAALGMMGATVQPNLAIKDANIEDYDAIIVIGGSGSPQLMNHKEVLDVLQAGEQNNKLIAGICLGPMVLAKAGVLKGKKATVWNSTAFQQSIKALDAGGAKFTDKKIVEAGNVITAFGPDQAHEFGKLIAEKLKDKESS